MRIAPLLAMLIAGTCVCPAHGEENCAWDPHFVSADAKAVRIEAVQRLPANLRLKEIVARLGPARREVGLGTYVLQWEVASGEIFSVTASGACAVPLARSLTKPR
jgi:hypothetical protein